MAGAADLDAVRTYVAQHSDLAARVGSADDLVITEVGDGNINFLYIVAGPLGSICIKKALPFVRCVGESWSLTQERLRIEADALRVQHTHCPQHVPEVYVYDAAASLMAMQYLAPPFQILRKGFIDNGTYPQLAQQLATFLATTLYNTSLLHLDTASFRQQARQFHNHDMCKLTEDVIFTEPYMPCPNNRWTSPQLDAAAQQLHAHMGAKLAVSRLKAKFCQSAEALIHGDFHTGSIMATADAMFVIDAEFAFVGPMAFDVGKILANLLLAYYATDGLSHTFRQGKRDVQQAWLLDCVQQTWQLFCKKFVELWSSDVEPGDLYPPAFLDAGGSQQAGPAVLAAAQQQFLQQLYGDVVSFAGAFMIRRLVGIAHVAEMDSIQDADVRAACELRALSFGLQLLVEGGAGTCGGRFNSIGALVAAAGSHQVPPRGLE